MKSSRRVHYFFHLTSFKSWLDPGDDSPKYVKNCLFQKIPLKQQKSRRIKAYNLLKRLKTVQNSLKVCQLLESNQRPSLYEGDALPTELNWHFNSFIVANYQLLSKSFRQFF